jgi:CyaY protein
MDEMQFEALAAQALQRIERALEESGIDADFELKEGGVLELEFDDGSKIIVNRHGAAREIWVAARSGGYHFRWTDQLGAIRAMAPSSSPRFRSWCRRKAVRG